ncbi:DUF3467 domain-containing protein [Candidatus Woesearchaeota archaeon]|nr:DUF3467 domain-containing protein [Candidatus Woesearchaeota archaeon]
MDKNLNISVNEGDSFFCHELSVNYNPLQFTLDFKCITPRVDIRSKQGPVVHIKHNVVMIEPFHAKKMLELLKKVVTNYEEEFGEIIKPKAVEQIEKRLNEKKDDDDKKTISTPTYFG